MKNSKKKALGVQAQIGRILWEEWDPIGVRGIGPDDEYNGYVGGIYGLLASGAGQHELLDHLYQLETVSMGLPGDKRKLESVVERLLKLDIGLKNQ